MFSGGASPCQSYTKVRRKDMLKAKSVRGKTGASPKRGLAQYFVNNWDLYAMLLLPIVYIVIFKYVPMAGVQMAFRDYSVFKGMWDSPWVGLRYFEQFFTSMFAPRLIRNTLMISLYNLIFGFTSPIILDEDTIKQLIDQEPMLAKLIAPEKAIKKCYAFSENTIRGNSFFLLDDRQKIEILLLLKKSSLFPVQELVSESDTFTDFIKAYQREMLKKPTPDPTP